MIPANDAIVTCVTGMLLTALIVVWACRGYWRARADDAYQDGHSAGIETQIGRQQRARARPGPADMWAAKAYMERAHQQRDGEPVTDVIVADITTAGPGKHRTGGWSPAARSAAQDALTALDERLAASLVIPFPEGLPPDLRDWVIQTTEPAPAGPPAPPSPVRGEASLRRLQALTRQDPGGGR